MNPEYSITEAIIYGSVSAIAVTAYLNLKKAKTEKINRHFIFSVFVEIFSAGLMGGTLAAMLDHSYQVSVFSGMFHQLLYFKIRGILERAESIQDLLNLKK